MSTVLTIKEELESDRIKQALAEILPKHVTPERMCRVAIASLSRTPLLREADKASFLQAFIRCSELGLEPDGRRAHLIPFRNNKRNCVEVQLIIDYKGLVELMMNTGIVANIHADVYCEKDFFEVENGIITHKPNYREDRGAAQGAYCIVRMKDGTEKHEVMTAAEINKVRDGSQGRNASPWRDHWGEMAKKTVFRRASKWVKLSPEIRDAFEADDEHEEEVKTKTAKRSLSEFVIESEPQKQLESKPSTLDIKRLRDELKKCKDTNEIAKVYEIFSHECNESELATLDEECTAQRMALQEG